MPARAELFHKKKGKILEQLNQPIDEYTDLSPKGSIDEGIRELIDYINSLPGLVSTSSCAGRVSVFLEGSKSVDHPEISLNDPRRTENEHGEGQKQIVASAGGKGGGQWLFVSHDPISEDPEASDRQQLLGVLGRSKTSGPDCMPDRTAQFVHFKFEAMILHVLAASIKDAQLLLVAAEQAGFRESGAMNFTIGEGGEVTPMVAVRTQGLSFDAIIAFQNPDGEMFRLVDQQYLVTLTDIANERFRVNNQRIDRFRTILQNRLNHQISSKDSDREDPQVRRARKRAEGLARQQDLRKDHHEIGVQDVEVQELFSE